MSFRAVREGVGVFASKARSGLTPLRYGFWLGSAASGLRSLSRLWEGGAFALCARGFGVFASKARSGLTPLRCGFGGLRGIRASRYQASAR